MINKKTVEDFRKTKLNNFSWIKELKDGDLTYESKTIPYHHQRVCTYIGLMNDSFLYFCTMGTGKTKIILDILSLRKEEWKRALIISPNISTVSTWADEVAKHSNLSYIELTGTIVDRWKMLDNNSKDLYLLNYTGLQLMLTSNKKNSLEPDPTKIKLFQEMFDVLVIDEIHMAKSHKSLTFKLLKSLAPTMKLRYGLTGTPTNRSYESLWSQFNLIDLGETLGKNLTLYREAFFKAKRNYWGGVDYKFLKKYEGDLKERLANKSISYSENEINDLPDIIYNRIQIPMSEKNFEYYQEAYDDLLSIGRTDFTKLKLSFTKMRQVCSGFISFTNEEEKKIELELPENPKLNVLIDLIQSTPETSKVVVFLEHIKAGELVCDRLKKEKIKHLRLYGGTKNKVEVKDKFLNDPTYKVIVANIRSGGVGINYLKIADYGIFYELPLSNIDYSQAVKRIHRDKKTHSFIYSLITKDSVEEKIDQYLKEGKDILSSLLEGQVNL